MRPPLLGKKTTQEFPLVGDVAESDCGDGVFTERAALVEENGVLRERSGNTWGI